MPTRISPTTRDVGHSYSMLARLKPGVTLDQARAEMQSLFIQFKTTHGDLVDQSETGINAAVAGHFLTSGCPMNRALSPSFFGKLAQLR